MLGGEAVEELLLRLPQHQAFALYLAAKPGVTYYDVAAELRQDPKTILRWLEAGLRTLRPPSASIPPGSLTNR